MHALTLTLFIVACIDFFFFFFVNTYSLSNSHQQLAQKEKLLKEEVEEMKATLSCTEEGRARASAHSKNVVSDDFFFNIDIQM